MKVIATQAGFCGKSVRSPGDYFDIPDEPRRELVDVDDAITRAIAIDGTVPLAFSAQWMRPEAKPVEPEQSRLQRFAQFLQRDIRTLWKS